MYTIQLFQNVDAERSYDNVRWFTSQGAQESYFSGLSNQTINNATPFIYNGYFLCRGNIEDYRNFGYMRFWYTDNTGNQKKKVYCFIDDVKYKNQDVFELYFTVDSFQTYMLDLEIGTCWVEREHVTDDTIGNYLQDEGLGIGELKCNRTEQIDTTPNGYYVVVNATVNMDDPSVNVSGGIYNGIVSAGQWYAYDYVSEMSTFQEDLAAVVDGGKSDAIIGIFLIPKQLISRYGDDTHRVQESQTVNTDNYYYSKQTTLDGYTPSNNKLLTYPYVAIRISNNNGVFRELRQECFSGSASNPNQVIFRMLSGANSGVSFMIMPSYYNGTVVDFRYAVETANYPNFQWTNNPYATWLNQNSLSLASNVVSGAVQGGTAGSVIPGIGTVGGALVGGFTSALSSMISGYSYMQKPLEARGTQSGNILTSIAQLNEFKVEFLTLPYEQARSIDNYFTRYGYKVNRYKVPNTATRSDFNFVKTSDCNFTGNIPHKYLSEILNAFNKGVTLWHRGFN